MRASIISLCLCETSDPPHPPVQPPSFPLTSFKLPYHSLTHRTIREALSWWAKLPLCVTSPVGRAGKPGENEMRGEMEIWLQRVWLRPLPRLQPNQGRNIKKKVNRRRCCLRLIYVLLVSTAGAWERKSSRWIKLQQAQSDLTWFTTEDSGCFTYTNRKVNATKSQNTFIGYPSEKSKEIKCSSYQRTSGLSWYAAELFYNRNKGFSNTYLTSHVLRCDQEAHLNCARLLQSHVITTCFQHIFRTGNRNLVVFSSNNWLNNERFEALPTFTLITY